jgi:hypothetical protein
MKEPNANKPENTTGDEYARFMSLLASIVAVPKTAIYELDPRLRPKPRPNAGAPKDGEQS